MESSNLETFFCVLYVVILSILTRDCLKLPFPANHCDRKWNFANHVLELTKLQLVTTQKRKSVF